MILILFGLNYLCVHVQTMFSPILKKLKQIVFSEPTSLNTLNKLSNNDCNSNSLEDDVILMKNQELKETVYDLVRTINDPEKPATLEDLEVVYEDGVQVTRGWDGSLYYVTVEFKPTVAHCSLATIIGLCIRVKLEKDLLHKVKLKVYIKKGTHQTEDEVNKQINDKERVAAALENPSLLEIVTKCLKEPE